MKKILISAFAAVASAAVFAGMNNVVISFSTPGPDRYSDGTDVEDGECYALVWTPAGAEFAGIGANGKASGDSKVVLAAPVAKDKKCPSIMFEIDDQKALLEARLTPEATDEQVDQAQLLLVTLLEGLQAIERSYPRNVRIFFEERR